VPIITDFVTSVRSQLVPRAYQYRFLNQRS